MVISQVDYGEYGSQTHDFHELIDGDQHAANSTRCVPVGEPLTLKLKSG